MQLAADLAEVRAARQPADAEGLRTRALARFTAQDYEGAGEAYGVLLALPGLGARERLAALSNRAACWLPLHRCVYGCVDVHAVHSGMGA